MRKVVISTFLLIFTVILCTSAFAISTQYGTQSQIKVTLMSQTPDPVEPGDVVTLKFKIENIGHETEQSAVVKLLPQTPFTVYNDVAQKNIGLLRASSTGADAVVVEFKVKIDDNAYGGETPIDLQIIFGETALSYINDEFKVNIQARDAIVDIISVSSDPPQIPPGQFGTITIEIKNVASTLLKNVKFALDLDALPLAPYQSSLQKRIPELGSQYQDTITFKLMASPEAIPGLYKIPVNISFDDQNGNSYVTQDILAVTVGDTPNLVAYIKKSTVLQANSPGLVTIELANAGATNIKFVTLQLLPSEDYDLISTSTVFYIGNIDSDDTQNTEINLFTHRWLKELNVPIQLEYYDANNHPFHQSFDLKLPLYSSWTLQKFGVIPGSSVGNYVIIIILILFAYYYYRHFYKKNRKFSWSQMLADAKQLISRK
ncbi:COG1361 S-layer family protein [Candidatus Woesearchaeota archaeon]|nr:COG1361 S-layer family protein [Candidatus Woesearchaeota archaeon]